MIQVEVIQSDEIKLPAEFQVALYENLMSQLEHVKFQHVFRDGDRNATSVGDLVVLHSTLRGFKAGSERARQIPNCWPPCRGEKRRTFNCRASEDDLIEASGPRQDFVPCIP